MPKLAADIEARQQVIDVTGPGNPEPLAYFSIEDEVIQFHGFHRASQREPEVKGRWHVSRGVAGTTKAPHRRNRNVDPYSIIHPVEQSKPKEG